jgi:hypothetical protein
MTSTTKSVSQQKVKEKIQFFFVEMKKNNNDEDEVWSFSAHIKSQSVLR